MLKPHHRLYFAAFTLDFVIVAVWTCLPFYIYDRLGGEARMSGVIGGIVAASYAISSLISSTFVSRLKNPMRLPIVGLAGFSVLYLISSYIVNPYAFAAVAALGMMCTALIWPSWYSWIGGEPNADLRRRRLAHYNLSWCIGLVLGPLAGGWLYDRHFRAPFILSFVGCIAVAFLAASMPHEKAHFGEETEEENGPRRGEKMPAMSELLWAWLGSAMAFGFMAATRSVFPKRVAELADSAQLVLFCPQWPIRYFTTEPATVFSWVASCMLLAMGAVMLIAGKRRGHFAPLRLCAVSQVAAGLALLTLGWTHSVILMAVCCGAIGANTGLAFFTSINLSLLDPTHKHSRAAINESTVGGGSFAVSTAFGLFAGWYGTTAPFLMAPLIVVVGLAIQGYLWFSPVKRSHGNRR